MNIVEKLNLNQEELLAGRGASEAQIANAENTLQVKFASDFRQCLSAYGLFAFNGHELTGITDNKRLSIIEVTERQRIQNPGIPADYYVIEEANIDGIVVWQSNNGEIFGTMMGSKPELIAKDFMHFLAV